MANDDFRDSFKHANNDKAGEHHVGDCLTTRSNSIVTKLDDQKANTRAFVDCGVLPAVDLKFADGGAGSGGEIALKTPVGVNIADKDMKDAGVSARKYDDADGKRTEVKTKAGIFVTIAEGGPDEIKHGHKIHHDDIVIMGGTKQLHETKPNSNDWADDRGRVWVKTHGDGSATIDTGEGKFVRQDAHGVKTATVICEGKNFRELNTDTALGDDLRPTDMVKKPTEQHKK